jgi:hypothetical protein
VFSLSSIDGSKPERSEEEEEEEVEEAKVWLRFALRGG